MPVSGNEREWGPDFGKNFTSLILAVLSLAFTLAVTTTACAPLPCPGGYADPNWCHDEFIGGGG
jgi:hypothetical protein